MNILIAGGSGFIGAKLAEKLLKEGHIVTVVDINEPTTKLRPRSRAFFYNISLTDPDLEEVFKDQPIDIVFNCTLAENNDEESHLNLISGNIHLVTNSIKYKVKKFVYLSNSDIDILESCLSGVTGEMMEGAKYFVLGKKSAEEYCFEAFENTSVQRIIIRLPLVFGKGMKQSYENYYFTKFIQDTLSNKENEKAKMLDNFEMLHIGDCIHLTKKLTFKDGNEHKFYRLEGITLSAKEFVDMLSSIYPVAECQFETINKNDIEISKKKVVKVIKMKSSMEDVGKQFKNTFDWFIEKKNKKDNQDKKNKKQLPKIKKKAFYAVSENILGLILAFMGCILSNGQFDANLPYIMFMGMRYGIINSFAAVCMSVVIKLFILNPPGTFHLIDFIFMMISYLLAAFISSFVTDKYKGNLETANRKIKLVEEKLDSMTRRLNQSRKTISTLSEQIKVSDKSFGKVHQAIRRLDSFNTKKLFEEMKNVVTEISDFKKVYIYTVNRNEWMLDLYPTSREDVIAAEARINIYEHEVYRELMFKRNLFINKELNSDLPGAIIPIIDQENERVEAMVLINEIPFESLNAFTEYTLQMTGELISDAFTRAYKFENLFQSLQQGFGGYYDNYREGSNG